MSVDRYLPAARYVAQSIPGILAQRGLKPFISRFVLTETQQGNTWLFVVLEVGPLQHPEDYAAPDVLDHLSIDLHGLPVVISESYGLRYAVLLSSPLSHSPNDSDKRGWKAGVLYAAKSAGSLQSGQLR